jgi:uncharacterized protein YjbJ (UPF0337 family)
MGCHQLLGNRKQVNGAVGERSGKLTNDDVDVIAENAAYYPAGYKQDTASHMNRQKRSSRILKLLRLR